MTTGRINQVTIRQATVLRPLHCILRYYYPFYRPAFVTQQMIS